MTARPILASLQRQSFIITVLGAVALAALWPEAGGSASPLPVAGMTKAGVFWIFLSTGLLLPLTELRRALTRWPLHLFAQSWIFVVVPAMAWALLQAAAPLHIDPALQAGFLFLAILPCTISSALVLTTASGGYAPLALINSSLSNILCVFIVPVYLKLFFGNAYSATLPLAEMLQRLAVMIALPLAIGLALKPLCSSFLPQIKPVFRPLNNAIICFIIFTSFSRSFEQRLFSSAGFSVTLHAGLVVLLLLACSSGLLWVASKSLTPVLSERIALFFCGSQKALATGLPMAVSFYGTEPAFGLMILPLMLYHPAQLILGASLKNRFLSVIENAPSTLPSTPATNAGPECRISKH